MPLHQAIIDGRGGSLAALAAVTDSLHPNDLHAPADPFTRQSHPAPEPQFVMHSRRTVGPARRRTDPTDLIRQTRISHIARRRAATAPLVVARARHLHHPAGHRDINTVQRQVHGPTGTLSMVVTNRRCRVARVAFMRYLQRDVEDHVLLAADVARLPDALEDLVRGHLVPCCGPFGV
jgi:hypothetical protein